MLLDLREKVRNSKPIKYTLITIICIPFALVGIGSYLGGGGYADVAEVDGEAISEQDLERAYAGQRQRIAQMFGGSIPEGFMSEDQIRQQALDQLISNQVLRNVVEEEKFAVGDATLGRTIRNNPQFQVDGRFDSETYTRVLQSSYTDVAAYEQSVRESTALSQFQSGVFSTSFVLPSETSRLEELSGQTRTVDFVRYSVEKAMEDIEVSDEDASVYFEENSDNYKFPQRAKIEYIELDKSALATAVDISDEEAQTYYNDNKARYTTAESRDASHILLTVDDANDGDEVDAKTAQIADIKARIDAGESFADLAKEFSEDPGSSDNGGSLGQITPGAMVPAFEKGVYELAAIGDISAPIVSEFGVHLIKLDAIIPEKGKAFEEVKDTIISTIQSEEADSQFFDIREALSEAAFNNPESLEIASEESGLEIITSDWIDTDTTDDPLLSNPRLIETAFSTDVLEDGNNSDLIEISPDRLVTLRVLEHEEPRPKTLDDVKDTIVDTIKRERGEVKLDELAKGAIDEMVTGKSALKIAEDDELATAVMDEVLTRQSTVFDNSVILEVYALAKPAEGRTKIKSATLANGDRVTYALKAVGATEEPEETSSDVTAAVSAANPRLGQNELSALLTSLRGRAKVSNLE